MPERGSGLLAGTLVERAVVRIGRGPIQLCSAAGGELIVALASGGTSLTVLDGRTAEVRSRIEVGPAPYNAVADGARVYVAMHTPPPAECLDAIQVVDCEAGRIVSTVQLAADSRPKIIVPALERGCIYSLNWGNGTLTEIDATALTASRSIDVGRGPRYGQRWQGTLYVANGESNDLALVDEATLSVKSSVGVGRGPERCVVYKDRQQVYTNNLDEDTLSVVDLDPGRETARIPVGPGPIRITPWDSRGRDEWAVLCRGTGNQAPGTIELIDSDTHQVTDRLRLPGPVANWNWGPGPKHQTVLVTLAHEPLLVLVDAVRMQVLDTLRVSTQPEPAGLGPGVYTSQPFTVPSRARESGSVFLASEDSVTFLTPA